MQRRQCQQRPDACLPFLRLPPAPTAELTKAFEAGQALSNGGHAAVGQLAAGRQHERAQRQGRQGTQPRLAAAQAGGRWEGAHT